MDDHLKEVCAREVVAHIEGLFKNARKIPNTGMAEVPVIGGQFHTWADHSHYLLLVCKALCAREQHGLDSAVPSWARPLPLHQDECREMEDDIDNRRRILGFYGGSLGDCDYDSQHPHFVPFCRGLMAYKHTPIELRT